MIDTARALREIEDRHYFYRLDGHTPVSCSMTEWARARESGFAGRQPYRVAESWFGVPKAEGSAYVSTVFLSTDHAFGLGRPVLFETLVFWDGHQLDQECKRYCTWDEAAEGHKAMTDRVARYWQVRG